MVTGGMEWSNRLTQWLEYVPYDPAGNNGNDLKVTPKGNIAASWHSYNFNECNNEGCWDQTIAVVAAKYPLITGEIGENDCNSGKSTQYKKIRKRLCEHVNALVR
jgi:endoglucanase